MYIKSLKYESKTSKTTIEAKVPATVEIMGRYLKYTDAEYEFDWLYNQSPNPTFKGISAVITGKTFGKKQETFIVSLLFPSSRIFVKWSQDHVNASLHTFSQVSVSGPPMVTVNILLHFLALVLQSNMLSNFSSSG